MKRLASALALGALLSCGGDEAPRVVDLPAPGAAFPVASPGFTWPTGPFALLSNNGDDTVSVVDLKARAVVGSLRAGLNPVDLDGPHHLAFDKTSGQIFVALSYPAPALAPGPHAQHGSSQTPGKVVRLNAADGQISGQMRADTNPGDIALSQDGSRLVVTHFDLKKALTNASQGIETQRASLLVYDPADFRADASPRSYNVCVTPHGVALSRPDGRYAYVACYGEDALAVVDLADPDPVAAVQRIPVGPAPGSGSSLRYGPYAAVLSPDGGRVLIGDTEGRDLRVFDVASNAMTKLNYAATGAVYFSAVDAAGKAAYVPVQSPDYIARVNLAGESDAFETLRRSMSKDECQRPHEAVLWDNDQELLLVCEGDHVTPGKLLFLDPQTLETRVSLDVGVYPDKVLVVTP